MWFRASKGETNGKHLENEMESGLMSGFMVNNDRIFAATPPKTKTP